MLQRSAPLITAFLILTAPTAPASAQSTPAAQPVHDSVESPAPPQAASKQAASKQAASGTAEHISGLRSPAGAAVLGAVFPGAGLAYAGQWRRGVGTYFGTVSGIGLGGMLLSFDRCTFTFLSGKSCDPGRVWPQRAVGVGAIALGLGAWAYGAVDAARIVRRSNARKLADRRATFGSIEPTVTAPGTPDEPWRIGMHASW